MSGPHYRRALATLSGVVVAILLCVSLEHAAAQGAARPEIPVGLDLYLPVPADNPLTPERVALGRTLFFDPILSRDRSLACAGCHEPERAFTDGRALSVGVFGRVGTRSVPTLVNRAYGSSFFWDGRTSSLEEQVLKPIQDPKELDMTLREVVTRLRRDREYSERFQAVFGRIPTHVDLAAALASYVRTILSGDAPIDRYLAAELDALSEQARDGLHIFQGKARCSTCHVGPTFTDERFHNTGVAWRDGELLDPGRFTVTGKKEDQGAFKTPTLREIAQTAPYMHDGSLATLEEVIEFYNRGGNPNPYLDPELRPLRLTTEEKQALLAFLRALAGNIREGL
ncbi:cytochrome-c peroxidase [Acidobacteria bacterium AH-259-L09]|nr:cytochrome-c peroxidase [Acidobacteria bacterium AH-259-L09]